MKITILGAGTFGSAIGAHLSRVGHQVQAETAETAEKSELIVVSVPSYAVVSALLKVREDITNQKIIICSKGFTEDGRLISEGIKEKFENDIFFLYGPTLADELTKGDLSGMVLAGGKGKEELQKEIESESLRVELSDDIVGVQISAALKNVVTIFVGIVQGAGYRQNTQAFVFTRGVEEIKKIGMALGARIDTFLGLTCIGDIMLNSRNRWLGVEIGKGRNIDEVIQEMKYTPEGIHALKNIKILSVKHGIEIPFAVLLDKIIFEGLAVADALAQLR